MRYESKSILGRTVIDINPNGIDVEAKDKVTHYDFSDYMGTSVIKNYYNGIYTGKTRYISFHDESAKFSNKKTLNFSAREKDDFMKIAADIDKTRFDVSDKSEDLLHYFDTARSFSIQNDSIKSSSLKYVLLLTVLPAVILLIALIVSFFIPDETASMTIKAICAAVAICGVILVIPEISFVLKGMKNIPSSIMMDSYTLRINEDAFSRESIEYVKITPASYTKWERLLTVKDRDGEHRYSFGSSIQNPHKVNPRTMPDYDNLNATVRLWCHLNNVTFYSDLG